MQNAENYVGFDQLKYLNSLFYDVSQIVLSIKKE